MPISRSSSCWKRLSTSSLWRARATSSASCRRSSVFSRCRSELMGVQRRRAPAWRTVEGWCCRIATLPKAARDGLQCAVGARIARSQPSIICGGSRVTMPADLKTIPLFRGLQDTDLRSLSEGALIRAFPKNSLIINEGDFSDSLYLILSGKVKVYLSDESGKELILDIKGPGDYFGEMVLSSDR